MIVKSATKDKMKRTLNALINKINPFNYFLLRNYTKKIFLKNVGILLLFKHSLSVVILQLFQQNKKDKKMLEVKLDLRPDIKKMLEIAFERNYSKSYASLEEFLANVLHNAVKNLITKEAFENKGFVISLKD